MGALQCSGEINTLVQIYVSLEGVRKCAKRRAACEKPLDDFLYRDGLLVVVLFLGLRPFCTRNSAPDDGPEN